MKQCSWRSLEIRSLVSLPEQVLEHAPPGDVSLQIRNVLHLLGHQPCGLSMLSLIKCSMSCCAAAGICTTARSTHCLDQEHWHCHCKDMQAARTQCKLQEWAVLQGTTAMMTSSLRCMRPNGGKTMLRYPDQIRMFTCS